MTERPDNSKVSWQKDQITARPDDRKARELQGPIAGKMDNHMTFST